MPKRVCYYSSSKRANVKFSMPYLTSNYVAKSGVKGMLKGKYMVTPGILGKIDKIAGKYYQIELLVVLREEKLIK